MLYDGTILIKNFDDLYSQRINLSQRFERCKAFASPGKYGTLHDNRMDNNNQRAKENRPVEVVIDYVSAANFTFSRGLFSNLCPPSTKWFDINLSEKAKKFKPGLKDSLAILSTEFYELLYARTNFATEVNESTEDAGAIGTICTSVELDLDNVLKFKTHDINTYYVEESQIGKKDTVYRLLPMTALQIVNFFKEKDDNIPKEILEYSKSLSNDRSGKVFEIIHYVAPNRDREYNDKGEVVLNKKNAPFVSIYVDKKSKEIIRHSGYQRNPYIVGSIDNPVMGVYSDSPAQRSLRTAKLMNKTWVAYAKANQSLLQPSVALDMSAYENLLPEYYFEPNSVNVYNSNGGQSNPPQFYVPPTNLPMSIDFIQRMERIIDNFFATDLFNLITNLNAETGRQRTAYEIQQLVAEKNNMILPLVARYLDEYLSPLLINAFAIAINSGVFGQVPFDINDDDLKIEYFSPLALAAKRTRINGTLSAFQQIAPFAETRPEVLDIFKTDKLVRDIAVSSGAFPEHLNNEIEIAQIRQQRMQQQAQEMQAQQMMDLAKSQNLTGEVADNSLAGQLVGGM